MWMCVAKFALKNLVLIACIWPLDDFQKYFINVFGFFFYFLNIYFFFLHIRKISSFVKRKQIFACRLYTTKSVFFCEGRELDLLNILNRLWYLLFCQKKKKTIRLCVPCSFVENAHTHTKKKQLGFFFSSFNANIIDIGKLSGKNTQVAIGIDALKSFCKWGTIHYIKKHNNNNTKKILLQFIYLFTIGKNLLTAFCSFFYIVFFISSIQ